MKKSLLSLFLCSTLASSVVADEAKPWTFWYWMNGAVTQKGITTDLEAMSEIGLEGCYLMPIYGIERRPELGGTIRQGTPEWWQMVDYSLKEADRLGLKIGLHICDGFALAGGPWISPAQSMQMVVSSDTILSVGKKPLVWSNDLLPAAPEGFYADIAAYAIPLKYQPVDSELQPTITSESPAFGFTNKGWIKAKEACSFDLNYTEPVTISALQIKTYNNNMQGLRMKVYANGQLLSELTPPRHGWQNYDHPTTVALPTVTTQRLHFEWSPEGTEPGSEDLDNGKWGQALKVQEIKVLATPRIDDWEGKCGRVWRVSSATQDKTSAEMYVPQQEMIRLKPGTSLPKGDWRIVRIGHVSTLHENATGGDCKGLECDKFSVSATQSQLDHWFGAAFENCDPATAQRVLKYMHIDSWECACQNWSDSIFNPDYNPNLDPNWLPDGKQILTFADYFTKQRGYDLMPYLPLMVGIPVQDQETSEQVLRDVRLTIAQLVDEVFYPTLVKEARHRDCHLSAESVAPTMISDGMAHYKHADYPMGEFWLNSQTHDKPTDMLDAINGGHVYGKQIIQAEGFTELRGIFNEVPSALKPLLDKQYCMGINRLFFHVYAHNPDPTKKPGMTLDGIGLFFQRNQTWWNEGKAFVDYITRCQHLLQMGRPVVELAAYTGQEMPRRSILPERLALPKGYIFDSYNEDVLIRDAQGLSDSPFRPQYKALILPGTRRMDPDNLPLSPEAKIALDKLKAKGLKVFEGTPSREALEAIGLMPDAIVPEQVGYTHRRTVQGDLYFLSNQQNEARSLTVTLRDHLGRQACLYDPVSDTYQMMEAPEGKIELSLPAYGSCFVLFGWTEGTLRQEYGSCTELSVKQLTPYQVHFAENDVKVSSDTLFDWSTIDSDSIRYYSGRATYSYDIKCKLPKKGEGRLYLQFSDLHDLAGVSINGKDCGIAWTAPYEVDVTDALVNGKNHIDIQVVNSWNNAIFGHDNGHDPFDNIWTNAKYRAASPKLLPAGLGPVKIIQRR